MISIRNARVEDFAGFLIAEKEAWREAPDVPVISEDQFATWLEVFPEGLWLAERKGEICGHIFSQICFFDPYNIADNRNWDEVTDRGFAVKTHNPEGNTLYTVSISASHPGAGIRLVKKALTQAADLGLEYCAGACRVPGVCEYAQTVGRPIDDVIEEYLELVRTGKIGDGTLSVLLHAGTRLVRGVPGYFKDRQSGDWGALIVYHSR